MVLAIRFELKNNENLGYIILEICREFHIEPAELIDPLHTLSGFRRIGIDYTIFKLGRRKQNEEIDSFVEQIKGEINA